MGLIFPRENDCILRGYSDASYGGDYDDSRSTSGYVFALGGAVISWSSRRQRDTALSSAEAEYMALCEAVKEAIWLRRLLADLGEPQNDATVIYVDSESAIAISKTPAGRTRTRHINVRYHFIREKIESKEIRLVHCSGKDEMIADALTKGVPTPAVQKFIQCMGGNIRHPTASSA